MDTDDKLKDLSSAASSPPAPLAVQQQEHAEIVTVGEGGVKVHVGNNNDNHIDNGGNGNGGDDIIPPVSKFKVFDKVIARDKDGLMYDAVIRRCLYGSGEPQQIPIGLFSNAEAEAILNKRLEQEKRLAAVSVANDAMIDSEPPAWHYFVHYNKWAVNWDRWVSQDDVYEPTEKIKAYAARVQSEHKDLSNRLASLKPGKKKRQTIDGNAFLGQWRLRLERIDAEMNMYNPLISPFSSTSTAAIIGTTTKSKQQDDKNHIEDEEDNEQGGSDKKSKKGKRGRQPDTTSTAAATAGAIDRWSKATLAAEMKNRNEHNLTNLRQPVVAKKLILPFALHKILVDQWEIISQCSMLSSLPAPVTVRHILDRYLASKVVQQQQPTGSGEVRQLDDDDAEKNQAKDRDAATTTDDANNDCSPTKNSTTTGNSAKGTPSSPLSAKRPPSTEKNSQESQVEERKSEGAATGIEDQPSLPKDGNDTSTEEKHEEAKKQDTSGANDTSKDSPESSSNDIPQEFVEMAEGIASFFDQALPTRLLYRQEIPQLRVLDAILPEEYKEKRLSEIYGGEHLLRLFIRLPEALVDGFAAAAAAARSNNKNADDFQDPSPRILALLSDFARFLHKHQSTLFCQSHRKWTTVELKEQQKMNAHQQRRKQRAAQQQPPPPPSSATSTSTSKHDVNEGKVEGDSAKKSAKSPPSSQGGRKRRKTSPK